MQLGRDRPGIGEGRTRCSALPPSGGARQGRQLQPIIQPLEQSPALDQVGAGRRDMELGRDQRRRHLHLPRVWRASWADSLPASRPSCHASIFPAKQGWSHERGEESRGCFLLQPGNARGGYSSRAQTAVHSWLELCLDLDNQFPVVLPHPVAWQRIVGRSFDHFPRQIKPRTTTQAHLALCTTVGVARPVAHISFRSVSQLYLYRSGKRLPSLQTARLPQ